MRLPRASREHSLQPPMTPLIDVVFLLLVFFVWNSSFDPPEFQLGVQIASDPAKTVGMQSAQPQEPLEPKPMVDEVILEIEQQGNQISYRINSTPVANLADLERRLRLIHRSGAEPSIILKPMAEVVLGSIVDVFDLALAIGFVEVLLAP